MGNRLYNSSVPSRDLKYHFSLEERKKRRFVAAEPPSQTASHQASIDKTSPVSSSANDEIELGPIDSAANTKSWEETVKLWKTVVPGTEEDKKRSLDILEKLWKKSSLANDLGKKTESAWKAVIRDTIIDQLSLKAGFQIHKSTVSNFIFYRIRAPIKLLELQAKREGYRLQFRGEVDPGSEQFWNVQSKLKSKEYLGDTPELEEDRRQYSKEEASQILGRLQRAGKISPMDMSVNQIKETRRVWSRRVHALERIADQVSVWNKYPAYAPFILDAHLRYLFQTYPGIRGKTLFRSKDRLYLTKAIIDRFFDMGKLVEDGFVEAFMALHDANRGESLTIDTLQKRWATFWLASEYDVGSPLVTDEAYEEDVAVSWYLRPFSQPLGNIREYMGEKLALHFAWLGSYTYNMILPALVGLSFSVYQYSLGYSEARPGIDYFQVIFIVFLVYWCVYNKTLWSQQSVAISLKWGTRGFEAAEKDRPQFQGDPEKPFVRSVITNRRITHFPVSVRHTRMTMSAAVVVAFVIGLICMVVAVYFLEFVLVVRLQYQWGLNLCSFLSAAQIFILSTVFRVVARRLNDWENHRSQTAYEDQLTLKTFSFEIFNSFSALSYICFFKGILHSCTNDSCIDDLRAQLLSIIVLRYCVHLSELFIPYLTECIYAVLPAWTGVKARRVVVNKGNQDTQFLSEFNRSPDEGTYLKYAEMVLDYGYLALFGSAWPLIFTMSLVDNLTVMRVNAWKQCAVLRRPDIQLAEDVGMWTEIMDYLTILGIYYNVAIFVWTGKSLEGWSILNKLLFFLVASEVLLMVRLALETLLGGIPLWIKQTEARQHFIMKKHLEGADDIDDSMLEKEDVEVLPEEVDVDGKSLYDFRDRKINKIDRVKIEELIKERRKLQSALLRVTQDLEMFAKEERFNKGTQMGESLDGSPLGLLRVVVKRVFDLYNFEDFKAINISDAQNPLMEQDSDDQQHKVQFLIRIELELVGDRVGELLRGDDGVKFVIIDCGEGFNAVKGISVDQAIAPITPIASTHNATVVFRLITFVKEPSGGLVRVGESHSTTMPLSKLSDQLSKVVTLQLYEDVPAAPTDEYAESRTAPSQEGAKLQMQLLYVFSNISKLRKKFKVIKTELDEVEQRLSNLKLGKTGLGVDPQEGLGQNRIRIKIKKLMDWPERNEEGISERGRTLRCLRIEVEQVGADVGDDFRHDVELRNFEISPTGEISAEWALPPFAPTVDKDASVVFRVAIPDKPVQSATKSLSELLDKEFVLQLYETVEGRGRGMRLRPGLKVSVESS